MRKFLKYPEMTFTIFFGAIPENTWGAYAEKRKGEEQMKKKEKTLAGTRPGIAIYMALTCIIVFFSITAADADQTRKEVQKTVSKISPSVVETEVITVTAGKRTEAITNLNASVSVMTKEKIEQERIESVDDFQGQFANVHVQSAGGATNSFVSIRGIMGQTVPMTPSGVSIYIDDVTLIDPLSNLLSNAYFFDLDQIEVLRGPQGTLYGRNAEAGVMVIKTKEPEHHFSARLLGEVGSYNKKMGSAVINLPLVKEKVAARISTSYLRRDGYTDNICLNNTAADVDEVNVRGKLLWEIGDHTRLLFTAENYRVRDGAQDLVPFTISGVDWDQSKVNTDVDGHENRDMTALSMRLNHDLNWGELISITAYRNGDESTLGDPDFWSYDAGYSNFDLNQKQFSQELRLISKETSLPWKWLAGTSYYKNDLYFDSLYHMGPLGFPMEMDMTTQGDGNNMGTAIFADIEYLFSQGLRLGTGIRGQYYKDELTSSRYVTTSGQRLEDVTGETSNRYHQFLGKLSVAYDFTSMSIYGLVSQGSRAGGIVSLAQTNKMHHYDPETAMNYEIGFKGQLPHDRGYFDLTIFLTDIEDLHVSTTGTGGFQYVSNAGKARNIGGELELNLKLVENLTTSAAIGYVNATLEEYKNGGHNYTNNKVPRVPDVTGTISLQYRREIRPDLFLTARGRYQYIGETFWDLANTHSEEPYTLVNATLGLEGSWWRCYLWGKNLMDEKYVRTTVMWGDMAVGAYGAPLTWGGTVQILF